MSELDQQLEEERLIRLFHEATENLTVPLDQIVRGGRRRGIGMRRRRRALQVLSGLACSAAVVGSFLALQPILHAQSDQSGSADSQRAASAPLQQRHTFGVATSAMATTLAARLPGSGSRHDLATWADGAGAPAAGPLGLPDGMQLDPLDGRAHASYRAGSLVYDDGDGRAAVTVVVSAPEGASPRAVLSDAQALCARATGGCTRVEAGQLVVQDETAEAARGGSPGLVSTSATLVTDDGFTVQITAYNAPQEKGSTPTRELPPFTGTQLATVATNPVWLS